MLSRAARVAVRSPASRLVSIAARIATENYDYDTPVTLTAVADPGSTFDGWSGDADCADGSVTMDTAKSCIATFTLNTHDLTIATSGTGSGTVTPAVGVHSYDYGTVVTLEATADPGSTFDGWSGDADCADGSVTMDVGSRMFFTTVVALPVVFGCPGDSG